MEKETTIAVRLANYTFAQPNLVKISVADECREMHLNAAGFIEAMRQDIIHCCSVGNKENATELLQQLRHLRRPDDDIRCVIGLAKQFSDVLHIEFAGEFDDEVWQVWAENLHRWKYSPLPVSALTEQDAYRLCVQSLLLSRTASGWELWQRPNRNSTEEEANEKPLWQGKAPNAEFYQLLAKHNPVVADFVQL